MTATAADIAAEVLRRPATLGEVRLLCIDGPAGSGKTTLAASVAAAHPSAVVVHMDDVFEGWAGLRDAPRRVRDEIVEPLRHGVAASFRRYDWHRNELAETVTLPATDLLIIEGVAAGDASYADAITMLIYVTAPVESRLRRGLDRDGEQMRPQWLRWQSQECEYLRGARTEDRADLVIRT